MDFKAIAMGLAFAFVWASAFTSTRIIVAEAPPLMSLTLRFVIAGGLGVLIALALGQSWRLSRRQWRALVVFGVAQNALYLGLNWVAMQTVEASLAAIIASAMPLVVGVIGWLVFGERLPPLGSAGLVVGMTGVGLIMGTRMGGGADLVGVGYCVLAVVALAIATLSVRGTGSQGNVMMMVGLQMLIGAAALLPFALAFETWDVTMTPTLYAAFAYAVLGPGLVATGLWFGLVNRIGAVRAAVFHFLTPVFGVSLAAALLGESLGMWDVIGVLVVTAGILAVQLSKQR